MATATIGEVRPIGNRVEVRADFQDGPAGVTHKFFTFESGQTIDDVFRAIGAELVALSDAAAVQPLVQSLTEHKAAGTVITIEQARAAA